MLSEVVAHSAMRGAPHPNDLDLRRIERSISTRKRYRYVEPKVYAIDRGYRIESPCCSRNVDPAGGVVDVALLLFDEGRSIWRLYRKDHVRKSWEYYGSYGRLQEVLISLNADPDRKFWQ